MPQLKTRECVEFGTRLRKLRTAKGFSQEGFAEIAEVHRTYLGGLERGERNPTLSVLSKLAVALGVTLTDLLKDVHPAHSKSLSKKVQA